MESSRIPFLEELALFLKGIVIPRIDFWERVLIYPRSGFSSTNACSRRARPEGRGVIARLCGGAPAAEA